MTRRLSILAFVLVLAIASLGLAYGAWSQTLTINGTANTGNLDAIFLKVDFSDDAYATEAATISDSDHQLTLTLGNMYPGYTATFNATIKNTGSIPVKVPDVVLTSSADWVKTSSEGCTATQLAVGAAETCTLKVWVPAGETGHMNEGVTLSGTINVTQFNQ